MSNGELVYLARRWRGEIFCGGEKSISTAISLGKEEWAFDYDLLLELRFKKVRYVGVVERDRGGMTYVTELETCINPDTYSFRDLGNRSGVSQHFVSHKHFIKTPSKTKF